MRPGSTNLDHTLEILDTMGVVVDDRPRAFDLWLAAKLDGLAPAIAADVRAWVKTLRDGGPRTRGRNPATACSYLNAARPLLVDWSDRYDHLREVTRDDVLAHLDKLTGHARGYTATAVRSLFRCPSATG